MRAALTGLRGKLPDLDDDLRLLADLYEQSGASARESTLAKARTIVDKVLKALCEKHDVSWGKQNPTIENMIGPLVAAKVIPGLIAAHVRTVQSYGNLAAHGEAVTAEHVELGVKALVAFLQWHAGDAPETPVPLPRATVRSRRVPIALAASAVLAGTIGVAIVSLKGDKSPPAARSAPEVVTAQADAGVAADAAVPAGPPLVVDLAVATPAAGGERALAPDAKVKTGDKIAFRVSVSDSAHVYVLQRIGDDLQPLFPGAASPLTNPLAPGVNVRIPDKSWFKLVDDGVYGPVQVTVIASRTPLPDLDGIVRSIGAQEGEVRNQAVKQGVKAVEKLGDPVQTGPVSRGQLVLLDDTRKKTVSVSYKQRPGDPVVVAAFQFQQVK